MRNSVSGTNTVYVYDSAGNRVGEGTSTASPFSCSLSSTVFTVTKGFVVGLNGEQLTETNGGRGWTHTNVFASRKLLATYYGSDLYFAINDWLGTKRAEMGTLSPSCLSSYFSLPFGNTPLPPSGNCSVDATEHHFTGKERDTESGNDYFGARYYASSMGRFMSPDWAAQEEPVPYANLDDPQSLNLYAYVRNNPLTRNDPDGHDGEGEGEGQDGSVVYKPGIPLPSPAVSNMLSCTASCSNQALRVTSTSEPIKEHPAGTPHADGKAADVTVKPGTESQVTACAKKCGAQFTQDEVHNPIKGHTTGPHVHLQTVPGKGHRKTTPSPAPNPAPAPEPASTAAACSQTHVVGDLGLVVAGFGGMTR
jgi:RHS repeat-associated protein